MGVYGAAVCRAGEVLSFVCVPVRIRFCHDHEAGGAKRRTAGAADDAPAAVFAAFGRAARRVVLVGRHFVHLRRRRICAAVVSPLYAADARHLGGGDRLLHDACTVLRRRARFAQRIRGAGYVGGGNAQGGRKIHGGGGSVPRGVCRVLRRRFATAAARSCGRGGKLAVCRAERAADVPRRRRLGGRGRMGARGTGSALAASAVDGRAGGRAAFVRGEILVPDADGLASPFLL